MQQIHTAVNFIRPIYSTTPQRRRDLAKAVRQNVANICRTIASRSSPFMVATVVVSAALLVLASVVPAINPIQSASAAFPGTNGKIAFSRQTGFAELNIFVTNPDGSGLVQLTTKNNIDGHPSWSPDGTKIVFEHFDKTTFRDQIYIMNADGSGQTNLSKNGTASDTSPSWSPDGRKIVFTRTAFVQSKFGPAPGSWIYVMNASDGSGQTKLADDVGNTASASWSPDGTKIVFGKFEIKVMKSDGSNVKVISQSAGGDYAPSWSPDGTKIAFNRRIEIIPNPIPPGFSGAFTSAVYVMNAADGSGQTKLTDYNDSANPAWSPDGTKIVFGKFDPITGKNQIYVMNAADGSGQTKLTEGFEPDWSAQPHSKPAQNSTLTVNAVSQNDGQVLHIYTKILSAADGTVLKRGFTPMNFTGSVGTSYTVTVANYLARDFDHWDNNSNDRTRTINLASSNAAVTAFYDTSFSTSGYTKLTYDYTAEKPTLTVNATALGSGNNNNELHMWTIIKLQDTNAGNDNKNSNTTYTVAASNYGDEVFDHWEDGSTHRLRTLDISKDTTIIAYYRTG